MSKGREIFIIADKRCNWIAGGSIKNTISGRVGYYANHAYVAVVLFWLIMQGAINVTFFPFDNWGHCHQAYHSDKTKGDYKPTRRVIFFFLLTIIVFSSCLILIVPFYLCWALGFIKQKKRITLDNV